MKNKNWIKKLIEDVLYLGGIGLILYSSFKLNWMLGTGIVSLVLAGIYSRWEKE